MKLKRGKENGRQVSSLSIGLPLRKLSAEKGTTENKKGENRGKGSVQRSCFKGVVGISVFKCPPWRRGEKVRRNKGRRKTVKRLNF